MRLSFACLGPCPLDHQLVSAIFLLTCSRTRWFRNTKTLETCQATIRAQAGRAAVQLNGRGQGASRRTGPGGTRVRVGLSRERPGGPAQEVILAEALEVNGYVVFQGGHNKELQTGCLETTEMHSVSSGGWNSEIKVPVSRALLPEASWEEFFLVSSSFSGLLTIRRLWRYHSTLYLPLHLAFSSLCLHVVF